METLPMTGLVLAGGASRRLGRDKAFVPVGGRPLLDRVLDAVRPVCAELFILADDPGRFARYDIPVVPDRVRGEGPLRALSGGLRAMTTDWAFATSCDAPFLDPAVIRYLWRRREGQDAVVPFAGAFPQSLCALYSKGCVPAMEQALSAGERRMTAFFDRVRVRRIAEGDVRTVDPQLRSFHNVNTEAELHAAEALAGGT